MARESSEGGQAEAEIQITPEMVRAGLEAALEFPLDPDWAEVVKAIYYAMAYQGLNAFRMIAKRDLNVGAYATIRATWDRRPWRRMPKQAGASLP
jgi:hypothetical protein